MLETLAKLLGLTTASSFELVLFVFIACVVATLVGVLIDACSDRAGFGIAGNAIILLSTALAGYVSYAKFVQPLRYAPATMVLAIGFVSAVLGFLSLSYAKTRTLH